MVNEIRFGENEFSFFMFKLLLVITSFLFKVYPISIEVLGYYSAIVYLILFFSYIKTNRTFFSAYTIVLLFLILFHSGQVFVYLLVPSRYLPVFVLFDNATIYAGYIYSLLCIQVFDISYNFFYSQIDDYQIQIPTSDNYKLVAKNVSISLLLLISPLIFIETLKKTIYSLQHGYMNLYAYDGAGYTELSLMPYLNNLFVILCILYIVSVSFDKKKVKVPFYLLVLYALLQFISGSRSGLLSIVLPVLLIYSNHIKKINMKKFFLYGLLVLMLMSASVFMSKYRLLTDKSSNGMAIAMNYMIESNPIMETFIEMGGTLKTLLYSINIFDSSNSFAMGKSYIASFFLLFPNLFNILGEIHPAAVHTNLATWLMNYLHLDHGPGFSIITESYYNFGDFGVYLFILWGWIFAKILGKTEIQNEERNFMSYSALVLVIILIRGTTADFLRVFIYEVIILNLFIKILSAKKT